MDGTEECRSTRKRLGIPPLRRGPAEKSGRAAEIRSGNPAHRLQLPQHQARRSSRRSPLAASGAQERGPARGGGWGARPPEIIGRRIEGLMEGLCTLTDWAGPHIAWYTVDGDTFEGFTGRTSQRIRASSHACGLESRPWGLWLWLWPLQVCACRRRERSEHVGPPTWRPKMLV